MAKGKNVDYSQLSEYINKLKNAQKDSDILKSIAREIGNRIKADAKENTVKANKIDTGELNRQWHYKVIKVSEGYRVEINNSVSYAPYVEYGHRTRDHKGWVKGSFMLSKAVLQTNEYLPDLIEERLKEAVKEWGL